MRPVVTSVLAEVLDPTVVARVPVTGNERRTRRGEDSDPWVWTYLVACLATGLGYDEARAVVAVVAVESYARASVGVGGG